MWNKFQIKQCWMMIILIILVSANSWAKPTLADVPALSKKEIRTKRKQLRKQKRQARRLRKAQKFLNSRLGKWLIKRAQRKARKRYERRLRKAKRQGKNLSPKKHKDEEWNAALIIGFLVFVLGFALGVGISLGIGAATGLSLAIGGVVGLLAALIFVLIPAGKDRKKRRAIPD